MKGIVILFSLITFSSAVFAETPEEKGLAIAIEADKRDQGWGDQATASKMILRNSQGAESIRETRGKNLEVKGDCIYLR